MSTLRPPDCPCLDCKEAYEIVLSQKRRRQNRWVKAQRKRVPLEAAVERAVVARLEKSGRYLLPKFGHEGWPDRLVLLSGGRHCWFEFKRRKFGSLTPAQRRRIPALMQAGDHVYLIHDEDEAMVAVNAERSES